nr:RNA-directed DNA polymerase, eukaryota [Tanacetum cinerariifolium]
MGVSLFYGEQVDGECVILGDFNEVRNEQERFGSCFSYQGACAFNNFISSAGILDLPLEGYSFTLAHKTAFKMSRLDRFLITEGLMMAFPHLTTVYFERHLSYHRPILMRELNMDYGATPFRVFHSWFNMDGFDRLKLAKVDIVLDQGGFDEANLKYRSTLLKDLQEDVVVVVSYFFSSGSFPRGCNASFITLILKIQDAKVVKDFRPISLIRSVYKIITKVLENRLRLVMSDLIGFEKAFDFVRWDYLDDVLKAFGFSDKWRGLKQGDPLSPFLFILIMESLHLSFGKILDADLFKGITINDSLTIFHLFYADDVVFIDKVDSTARLIGCSMFSTPFNYLGVKVGGAMSKLSSWDEISVAKKMNHASLSSSFRRSPRGGAEDEQFRHL